MNSSLSAFLRFSYCSFRSCFHDSTRYLYDSFNNFLPYIYVYVRPYLLTGSGFLIPQLFSALATLPDRDGPRRGAGRGAHKALRHTPTCLRSALPLRRLAATSSIQHPASPDRDPREGAAIRRRHQTYSLVSVYLAEDNSDIALRYESRISRIVASYTSSFGRANK